MACLLSVPRFDVFQLKPPITLNNYTSSLIRLILSSLLVAENFKLDTEEGN